MNEAQRHCRRMFHHRPAKGFLKLCVLCLSHSCVFKGGISDFHYIEKLSWEWNQRSSQPFKGQNSSWLWLPLLLLCAEPSEGQPRLYLIKSINISCVCRSLDLDQQFKSIVLMGASLFLTARRWMCRCWWSLSGFVQNTSSTPSFHVAFSLGVPNLWVRTTCGLWSVFG